MQDSRKRSKALALKNFGDREGDATCLLVGFDLLTPGLLLSFVAATRRSTGSSPPVLQMTNSEQLDTFEVATDAWRMQGLEGGAGVYGGRRLERQPAVEQRGPSRRGETTTGPNEARCGRELTCSIDSAVAALGGRGMLGLLSIRIGL
ncbi:unnamed protein product [Urochloa humidicola]